EYLPFWAKNPIVWVDEPVAQKRLLIELEGELERSHRAAIDRGDLTLPPEAHYLSPSDLREQLAKLKLIEGGGLSLDAGAPPIAFPFQETRDLREAIRQHHGEEGALAPLVERLQRWRDEHIAAAIACGSRGQVDRLKRLLEDRGLVPKIHEG